MIILYFEVGTSQHIKLKISYLQNNTNESYKTNETQ